MNQLGCAALIAGACAVVAAQPPPAPATMPALVAVRPIEAPSTRLPPESASNGITRFSFLAYGDTRSGNQPELAGDGQVLNPAHNLVVDGMLARIQALATTPYPVRFILHSGDAVLRGQNGAMWNVSFTPIVERLTRGANIPYFFAAGNHDVTTMPLGSPSRAPGLQNTLTAMSQLIPPEGSPRRLNGYPAYAFGFGNLFALAIDSNIATDPVQLAWATGQLDHLDRSRYHHVIAFFHHPPFSSGPHGGPTLELQSAVIRTLYLPLFRKHHVRMTIAGHDHLLDHWVERYADASGNHRRDDVITGGGGAPLYTYKSEPDLVSYVLANAGQRVQIEHRLKPGTDIADNPHHFIVVQVDGDHLALEVVGAGPGHYAPYNGQSRIDLNDPGS